MGLIVSIHPLICSRGELFIITVQGSLPSRSELLGETTDGFKREIISNIRACIKRISDL